MRRSNSAFCSRRDSRSVRLPFVLSARMPKDVYILAGSNDIDARLLSWLGGAAHLNDRRQVDGLDELFEIGFLGSRHARVGIPQHVVQNTRGLLVRKVLLGSFLRCRRRAALFIPVFLIACFSRVLRQVAQGEVPVAVSTGAGSDRFGGLFRRDR